MAGIFPGYFLEFFQCSGFLLQNLRQDFFIILQNLHFSIKIFRRDFEKVITLFHFLSDKTEAISDKGINQLAVLGLFAEQQTDKFEQALEIGPVVVFFEYALIKGHILTHEADYFLADLGFQFFNLVAKLFDFLFQVFSTGTHPGLQFLNLECCGQVAHQFRQAVISCLNLIDYLDGTVQQLLPFALGRSTSVISYQIILQFFNQGLDGGFLITDDKHPLLAVDTVQQQVHDGKSLAGTRRSLQQYDIMMIQPVHQGSRTLGQRPGHPECRREIIHCLCTGFLFRSQEGTQQRTIKPL